MNQLFELLELPGPSLAEDPEQWESVIALDLRARRSEAKGKRSNAPHDLAVPVRYNVVEMADV